MIPPTRDPWLVNCPRFLGTFRVEGFSGSDSCSSNALAKRDICTPFRSSARRQTMKPTHSA